MQIPLSPEEVMSLLIELKPLSQKLLCGYSKDSCMQRISEVWKFAPNATTIPLQHL